MQVKNYGKFLGNKKTLTYENWPGFSEDLAKDDLITVAVQVNGKLRATLEVALRYYSRRNFINGKS